MECHDCKKPTSDHAYKVTVGGKNKTMYKCMACYKIDPVLRGFQLCEVYTRVVGYLRPRSQMNPGKLAEVKMRKNLNVSEEQI